jgi:hypothetical protein
MQAMPTHVSDWDAFQDEVVALELYQAICALKSQRCQVKVVIHVFLFYYSPLLLYYICSFLFIAD